MAAPTGQRVQTWLTPGFARELKELADQDGRFVSNLIRHVLEHELRHPSGEGTASGGDSPRSSRRDAGASEESA